MKRPVRETVELMIGAGIAALLTLAYVLLTARLLGPALYADFAAALSMIHFGTVALSPLGPTASRLVTRYAMRGELARIFALRSALERRLLRYAAIVAIPLLLAVWPIADAFRFRSPVTLLLPLAAILAFAILSIERGVLQGLGRFREYNLDVILETSLRLGGGIAMLWLIGEPWAALLGYVAALLIADAAIRFRLHGPKGGTVDWTDVRGMVGPLFIAMIGLAVYQNADVLAAKRWLPPADAGFYAAAASLTRSLAVIFLPVYTVSGPMLTARHEAKLPLFGATLRLCGAFLLLAAVPVAALMFGGGVIVELLFGPTFAASGAIVARLAALPLLTYLSFLIVQGLITAGDRRFQPVYLGFAGLELVVLALTRGSMSTMIVALYVVQGAALLAMLALLARIDRDR